MDITALIHPSNIDVPALASLPDTPSSISSSTQTRAPPTSATSREASSSVFDDDPSSISPPTLLLHKNGCGRLTFPSIQHVAVHGKRMDVIKRVSPLLTPLPPILAPLTAPRLAPTPSIRRPRGTRPRPFVCWCGSAFSKREHLKRHDMLVHKALRPYRCQVCQVDFGTKQNMQVHFTTRKHRDREMFVRGRV